MQDLREGWTFFRSVTWLWVVVLGFGALNMIHNGALFTLGPVVAEDTIGRQAWGFVLSAEAAGLLLMALVLLRFRLERPLLWGMLAIILNALPMLMLGIDPVVVALVAAAFIGGMGIEVFSMGWSLAMQENIDDDMLSRAYSYDMLGSFIAMPIGQLAWGPLGVAFGNERVLDRLRHRVRRHLRARALLALGARPAARAGRRSADPVDHGLTRTRVRA